MSTTKIKLNSAYNGVFKYCSQIFQGWRTKFTCWNSNLLIKKFERTEQNNLINLIQFITQPKIVIIKKPLWGLNPQFIDQQSGILNTTPMKYSNCEWETQESF